MKNVILLSMLTIGLLLNMSCSKDADKIFEEQQVEIEDYLKEKGWFADATMLPSGIWYIIDEEGTGTEYPTSLSTVTVHYEGRLLDGTKFDSSYDRATPFTSSLQNVIGGWQIGIPLFKKGGKGKLFIPSKYGYGAAGSGTIPGNSVLFFDIELIDFD
jgi:FKBP-type peptidyl-prolyl cis-trans isomerase